MAQKPKTFDPNEFATTPSIPAFDPNEFAPPVQTSPAPVATSAPVANTIPPPQATPSPYKSFWDSVTEHIPSAVKTGWNAIWNPLTDLPSRAASTIAEPMMRYGESGSGLLNKAALYGGAYTQSLGNVVSGLTSPGNLALTAASGGAGAARGAGLETVANALAGAERVAGGATALHGGLTVANPESTGLERGMGVLEAIGGGLAARPRSAPTPVEIPISKGTKVTAPNNIKPIADPNYVGGVGDPELAGSVPYQPAPVPAAPFNPDTLDFVDPKTGEIKPKAEAKLGDVPIVPETPPKIPGRKRMILTEGDYKNGTSQVDTGPVNPANAGVKTPEEVVQSLSNRLQKAAEGNTSNPPKDVSGLVKDAHEALKHTDDENKPGLIRQVLGANKALLTSWDFSAPGRQGKAFIANKAWWTSLDDMFKAWGSKEAANLVHESIVDHPSGYFKDGGLAEKVGLDLAPHEEMFDTAFSKAVNKLPGLARSNRAHTAFLNKLRSDQFVSMMDAAKEAGLNPETNLTIPKAYAKFINDATGRGSLNMGSWKLERNMRVMNDVFFAPKNLSGQIRTWNNVLNPIKYANYDPVLRQQALKSLFAVAGVGLGVGELARMAGAQVSNDPTSSDFRKIKIGPDRIDPFGGYQQFPVAAMKMLTGQSTSTISGKTSNLTGTRFGQQTRKDVAETFFTNRLSPLGSFIWAWMNNKEFDGKPFDAKRAIFERVFPIAAKDIVDLAQSNPALGAATLVPTMFGLTGTQHYSGR